MQKIILDIRCKSFGSSGRMGLGGCGSVEGILLLSVTRMTVRGPSIGGWSEQVLTVVRC